MWYIASIAALALSCGVSATPCPSRPWGFLFVQRSEGAIRRSRAACGPCEAGGERSVPTWSVAPSPLCPLSSLPCPPLLCRAVCAAQTRAGPRRGCGCQPIPAAVALLRVDPRGRDDVWRGERRAVSSAVGAGSRPPSGRQCRSWFRRVRARARLVMCAYLTASTFFANNPSLGNNFVLLHPPLARARARPRMGA